ncbi:SigB/SigF/SigG family RNA polymerase sigma factor [Micromonospora sp. STR1_7]|uniref:SigB/SigF/SigG family RNA polymerase sigma factor n=1 Tax=Micromonospora parastrephiae TaxID=2806101 RepID=A0ABS1XNA2_9ACTN|nr:SigB/SigF/SigG family RNA polymerase sigma factor [Micromonospora parastrephiae]MBM0230733.1 SigB/SigF/SigG family RNA polymerase sigma factor [Micromonospora parastrephiae]
MATTFGSTINTRVGQRRSDQTPDDLLAALAATPADDPRRPALRDRTIEAWLPLARHLARRYAGRGAPDDDLTQTAAVGLIKAVDNFDPTRGVDFSGYAIPTVIGEIKRYFRDRTWAVRVPRRLQELRLSISAANSILTHTLGRLPTVADIASYLDVSEETVLEGLEGARAYRATSLSTPMGADGNRELGDTLGGDDHEFDIVEIRVALGPALATLPEREREILSLRFHGNLTQAQIADRIGISQMHVSRLITRSLATLRHHLSDDGAL